MNRSQLNSIIAEEIAALRLEAVPSNIQKFANREGSHAKRLVKQVDTWATKIGKRIMGGTAVGKNYSTLILDLTHQGGEIAIDLDEETIEVQGEPVTNFKEFEMAVMNLTNEGTVTEAKQEAVYMAPKGRASLQPYNGKICTVVSDEGKTVTVRFKDGKTLTEVPKEQLRFVEGTIKEATEYVDKDSPASRIAVRGHGNYITLMQQDFDDRTTTTFVVGTEQIAELIKVLSKFKS